MPVRTIPFPGILSFDTYASTSSECESIDSIDPEEKFVKKFENLYQFLTVGGGWREGHDNDVKKTNFL